MSIYHKVSWRKTDSFRRCRQRGYRTEKYGAPVFVQLDTFRHIQSTGLQIARAPGKTIVYVGFALLIAGVFFCSTWRPTACGSELRVTGHSATCCWQARDCVTSGILKW
ncbi:MAG: cytochrome c biogenesis protein ResB [Gammaproteobacteria bacterium]|nr:cytochrome c biogenesis protein ResB [Gammaproteobacteria bacterium]